MTHCYRCALPDAECKCLFVKGRYRCHHCGGHFRIGEQYYADSPVTIYHMKCYINEVTRSNDATP